MTTENQKFSKGSIVKVIGLPLSPEMRVEAIDHDKLKSREKEIIKGIEQEARTIHCIWFDRDGRLYERAFTTKDLYVVVEKKRSLKWDYPVFKKEVQINRLKTFEDLNEEFKY